MTRAQKRLVVLGRLAQPDAAGLADRAIARELTARGMSVSQPFVSKLRRQVEPRKSIPDQISISPPEIVTPREHRPDPELSTPSGHRLAALGYQLVDEQRGRPKKLGIDTQFPETSEQPTGNQDVLGQSFTVQDEDATDRATSAELTAAGWHRSQLGLTRTVCRPVREDDEAGGTRRSIDVDPFL